MFIAAAKFVVELTNCSFSSLFSIPQGNHSIIVQEHAFPLQNDGDVDSTIIIHTSKLGPVFKNVSSSVVILIVLVSLNLIIPVSTDNPCSCRSPRLLFQFRNAPQGRKDGLENKR